MKLFLHAFTLAGSLILSPLAFATDDLPVPPFQARYEVYGSGFSLGEAVMTLAAEGSGTYRMSSDVRPNGLVALLASARIRERASGEIRAGAIWSSQYEQRVEGVKKSRDVALRFDWPARQVQARSGAERATLPLSPGVVDPLSLNLVVMWDLQRGRLPDRYTLVDETEIKTFPIRNEGEEVLDTPLGRLRTVRVSYTKPGRTRITTFWFAPELQYLPVRIAQQKKGKEELRMEIRTVER